MHVGEKVWSSSKMGHQAGQKEFQFALHVEAAIGPDVTTGVVFFEQVVGLSSQQYYPSNIMILGWLKPYKYWDNHHPWWCRILSINSIIMFYYDLTGFVDVHEIFKKTIEVRTPCRRWAKLFVELVELKNCFWPAYMGSGTRFIPQCPGVSTKHVIILVIIDHCYGMQAFKVWSHCPDIVIGSRGAAALQIPCWALGGGS